MTVWLLLLELSSGDHWKYSVYMLQPPPKNPLLYGFTGWIRFRLSEGSMPNQGEKKADDFLGVAPTVQLICRGGEG